MPHPTLHTTDPSSTAKTADELRQELRILNIQKGALLAGQLQQAILKGDQDLCLTLCDQIASPALETLERDAKDEELGIRRIMHEIVADALGTLLLCEKSSGDHWKHLLLPDEFGTFRYPQLMANAVWLGICGSKILEVHEQLAPEDLKGKGLRDQACALGRFLIRNDGRSPIEYSEIVRALDPRLLPAFNNWVLTVHSMCPVPVGRLTVEQSQKQTLSEYLTHSNPPHDSIPATVAQATTAFTSPYWSDDSQRPIAEAINGVQMRGLFERFIPDPEIQGSDRPELGELQDADAVVLCPNWFDEHVIHRCMSPLAAGMLQSGSRVVRVYRELLRGSTRAATDSGDQTIDVFHSEQFVLADIALICRRMRKLNIDFAFHPEIVPVNASSWMATERIARVQATGYGFPVTSGLDAMDYFVGGRGVEPENTTGSDYTERLVLLPGLGVSTTPPPMPETSRERPVDDDRVHIFATASKNKLGTKLLQTWDAVQEGRCQTDLSLFTNMTEPEAKARSGAIGALLIHGSVNLNCGVRRDELIRVLSDADIYLDSFPFGGFNSIVEALVCGVPVVTLEGHQARNRFGAAIIRKLGLPDFLIAKSHAEYICAAKRLIGDPGLRQAVRDQLGSREEVLAKLADPHMSDHFDAAVAWMRKQGPRTPKSMAPVFIEAGEKPRVLPN